MADNGRLWSSPLCAVVAGSTLPEHHSALALLRQIAYAWFVDNLFKPRVGLVNAFRPSPSLSPYQSIELVDATRGKWESSGCVHGSGRGELPCIGFGALHHPEALATTKCSHESSNKLQPDQEPHFEPALPLRLFPQLHASASPPPRTVVCPPARMHAWSVENFQHVKELHVNQIAGAPNLESVDCGRRLRLSLVDTQLPQPALRGKKVHRKSLVSVTALPFDELQGLMDTGFHFSQDDLTPKVVTMFPALKQKLRKGGVLGGKGATYSEPKQDSHKDWLVGGMTVPSYYRQIPGTSDDMKEHLKFWARAVASTVRLES